MDSSYRNCRRELDHFHFMIFLHGFLSFYNSSYELHTYTKSIFWLVTPAGCEYPEREPALKEKFSFFEIGIWCANKLQNKLHKYFKRKIIDTIIGDVLYFNERVHPLSKIMDFIEAFERGVNKVIRNNIKYTHHYLEERKKLIAELVEMVTSNKPLNVGIYGNLLGQLICYSYPHSKYYFCNSSEVNQSSIDLGARLKPLKRLRK